jgi:L-ascorbate metabolism protein UlaG (beta-lactamase superfamily)
LGKLKGSVVKIGQMMAIYGEHFLPSEITAALHTLEDRTTALDWGGSATLTPAGIQDTSSDIRCDPDSWCPGDRARVFVTRNHHWGSRWFTDRNRALWSSFVVALPSGGNIFFAGDTGFGDGLWPAEAATYGPIRFAMIPIGAFRFAPGQMSSGSHVGPAEAALIHQRLGAARSMAIHWGTFRLCDDPIQAPLDGLPRARAHHGVPAEDFVLFRLGETRVLKSVRP